MLCSFPILSVVGETTSFGCVSLIFGFGEQVIIEGLTKSYGDNFVCLFLSFSPLTRRSGLLFVHPHEAGIRRHREPVCKRRGNKT